MATDLDVRLDALRELYAELPTIACKGLCANSCGPIDMSEAERTNIINLGVFIPLFTQERSQRWANQEPLHCPALNRRTLKCDVYEARPLICRIWGVGANAELQCPHGCETTGLLSIKEQFSLLLRSYEIGGHRDADRFVETEQMLAMLDDPKVGPLMTRFLDGERCEHELLPAIDDYRRSL